MPDMKFQKGHRINLGKKFPNRKKPLFSEEHKQNISNALKGNDPQNRLSLYTDELNENRRIKMMGKQNNLGHKHCNDAKIKIAEYQTGTKKPKTDEHRKKLSKSLMGRFGGEKSPTWQGGKSFEPYSINWCETLRRSIRERDEYVCRICFIEQGDIAHDVHHIDYDKKHCDPDNLITLCHSCHAKTNVNRDYWKQLFNIKGGVKWQL